MNDFGGAKSANITTQTTTTVHNGPCILRRVVFNKKTASGVVTIYDSLAGSGTKIGTITNPGTLLDTTDSIEYNVRCGTGCTVVTGSADQDLTVSVSPTY